MATTEDILALQNRTSAPSSDDIVNLQKDPTLEQKYLEPYVYPAIDSTMQGLSAVLKPASALATPILESARYGVRALSGQDTSKIDLNSDLKTLQNPRASATGLMEDVYNGLGIKQNNIGDLTNGWRSRDEDFNKIATQFPKAYNLLASIRPSDVAAMPVDAMLYGKIAAPAGIEGVVRGTEAGMNLFNKQQLAKNILKAGSTDSSLFNDLNHTGKINTVAQRIIDDPSLNRVDRTKVLDELNGHVVTTVDEHGVERSQRRGGQLNRLNEQQDNFVENLPKDEYTFDTMSANLRAKELLNEKNIIPSMKNAASAKIDEMIPYNQMDQSQINLIDKKSAISAQLDEVNSAVDSQKMEELSKLTKAQQEALQKKNSIPQFIDNPNRVPGRTEYYTANIDGGTDSNNYAGVGNPSSETSYKQYIPPVGDEQVWNKSGAQERMSLVKKIEDIQNQIDTLSGNGYADHPVMKNLVEKRDAIANQFWDLQDQGFPNRDAYADHITSLNQRPIQDANDIRKMANNYKNGLSKGTEEYNAAENAANATEQATSEAMNTVIGSVPPEQSSQYYQNQSKLSDLLNIKDLYAGTYAKNSGQPNVPMGGMIKGAVREAVNLKGQYIDPLLLDAANSMNIGNGNPAPPLQRPGTPMSQGVSASTLLAAKYAMGKGLVMNLADYEIPRDVDKILLNKQAVLAKVAQVSNDPNIVNVLEDALDKHPDKLETVLPALIMQFPNLFEADKYNRVNGKILDPMLRQKAYHDVESSGLSNTQKVMLQNGLNRDGTLRGF